MMKTCKISDIFDVQYGVNLELYNIEKSHDGIPFIARTEKDNGMTARVKIIGGVKPNPANTISVAVGGSVMSSFLQKEAYYSGFHIYCLKPIEALTEKQMLYYCMCLQTNKYRFSYGRQANKTLRDIQIPTVESLPEWVENTPFPKVDRTPLSRNRLELKVNEWAYFDLKDWFIVSGTKSITRPDIQDYGSGQYPYVTTSSTENGVEGFYNYQTEGRNVLTIDSATVGSCFYQDLNFSATDHVEKLIPKFAMNKYIALFLVAVIGLEKARYGYGRGFAQLRIKSTKIKLPIDAEGNPDWQFMEDYIKSLPYSVCL